MASCRLVAHAIDCKDKKTTTSLIVCVFGPEMSRSLDRSLAWSAIRASYKFASAFGAS